jgi:ubiquinone/menaquinone biosynthesis C-methylase UbiE
MKLNKNNKPSQKVALMSSLYDVFKQYDLKKVNTSSESERLAQQGEYLRAKFITSLLSHGLDDKDHILDLGCGHGQLLDQLRASLPTTNIRGLDSSPEVIQAAIDKYGDCFSVGNIYDIPFEKHTFDGVYSSLVFMHLSDPKEALVEITRVLKGRLVIIDSDDDAWFFVKSDGQKSQAFERLKQALAQLFESIGASRFRGRQLPILLEQAGFTEIQFNMINISTTEISPDVFELLFLGIFNQQMPHMITQSILSLEEGETLLLEMKQDCESGYFASICGCVASGSC